MNNTLTLKEISKQSFDTLVKSGYSPKYTDDEHIKFDCNIGGIKFSFDPIEGEVFEYSAAFYLKEKLSSDEIKSIGRIHVEGDEDYLIFEYFNKVGNFVYLSNLFNVDTYPKSFVEEAIKMLNTSEGIAVLKSKSYVWEPTYVNCDPAIKKIVKKCYSILVESGYSPEDFDDELQIFEVNIDGISFCFMWLEEERVFAYLKKFNLKKKMSERERERLEKLHAEALPEGVTKEELMIDGKFACLMGEFARDLSPEEMMEITIREYRRTDGIVAELKAKSYLKEKKYEG